MSQSPAAAGRVVQPWTCPFCPLLCDAFGIAVDSVTGTLTLVGSECPKAREGLERHSRSTAGAAGADFSAAIGPDRAAMAVAVRPPVSAAVRAVDAAEAVDSSGVCPPVLPGGLPSASESPAASTFTPAGPGAGSPPAGGGAGCELAQAIEQAARLLQASRQPLFGGLGTDVAGARALFALAQDTGAICDAAQGAAAMHALRALQDRGAYTATLAEVRTRADVIVCVTGSPQPRLPEIWRRCGVGEAVVANRHIVVIGGTDSDTGALAGLPGVSTEVLPLQGDLFDTVALLAAAVAGVDAAWVMSSVSSTSQAPSISPMSSMSSASSALSMSSASSPIQALAARLRAARYGVLVWEASALPAHGALIVEALNRTVGSLNRTTRAATLALGGGDGAGTAQQVHTWLSGLPLRTRAGPAGLEHEPWLFDAQRLIDTGAVDAVLWLSAFGGAPLPKGAAALPHVIIGPPFMAAQAPTEATANGVFIAVATPAIGSGGHLFRTDSSVLMPLHAVRADGLPSVAAVLQQLRAALRSGRAEAAIDSIAVASALAGKSGP